MFCSSCGTKLPEGSKFCPNCGKPIQEEINSSNFVPKNDSKNKVNNLQKNTNWPTVIRILVIIGSYVLGRILGIIFFIFILAIIIGDWFPKWFIRKYGIKKSFFNVIAWANVLTWIFPIVGILTGIASLKLSKELVETKKFRNLGYVGIILSSTNVLLGIYLSINS